MGDYKIYSFSFINSGLQTQTALENFIVNNEFSSHI